MPALAERNFHHPKPDRTRGGLIDMRVVVNRFTQIQYQRISWIRGVNRKPYLAPTILSKVIDQASIDPHDRLRSLWSLDQHKGRQCKILQLFTRAKCLNL